MAHDLGHEFLARFKRASKDEQAEMLAFLKKEYLKREVSSLLGQEEAALLVQLTPLLMQLTPLLEQLARLPRGEENGRDA